MLACGRDVLLDENPYLMHLWNRKGSEWAGVGERLTESHKVGNWLDIGNLGLRMSGWGGGWGAGMVRKQLPSLFRPGRISTNHFNECFEVL